jgi:hypothetical protein
MNRPSYEKLQKILVLDWKEISDEAIDKLKAALKPFGLHIGDAEKEYHGQAVSDTYVLYIAKKPMGRRELKETLSIQ